MEKITYSFLPLDWDYDCPELPKFLDIYKKRNIYTPFAIEYIADICGAFDSNKPLASIIAFCETFKQKWPIIKFGLYKGGNFAELELIKEF